MERINAWTTYKKREEKKVMDLGKAYRAFLDSGKTERLRAVDPKFALDIRLKVGRYNQHVSPYCLLVEVGHNANTFDDAQNSIPYLADAIASTLIIPKD